LNDFLPFVVVNDLRHNRDAFGGVIKRDADEFPGSDLAVLPPHVPLTLAVSRFVKPF